MIPKCSNLVPVMILGYPRSVTVLGFKGQGHRVSKFILHTKTLHTRTAIHQHPLGDVTSCQCGFEIGIECLLVICLVKLI